MLTDILLFLILRRMPRRQRLPRQHAPLGQQVVGFIAGMLLIGICIFVACNLRQYPT